MGTLTKLKIYAYTDAAFSQLSDTYTLQINPETYKHNHSTSYQKEKTTDAAGVTSKFTVLEPQTLSFDFTLDATGVIPGVPNLVSEIGTFKRLVYAYNGDIHKPNYVKLVWAGMQFKGRLTSLNIDYTLFKPSGMPLRAKLDVAFEEYLSPDEIAKRAKKNSPDLTHVRTVAAGDTLPLMCYRVYGDSQYYLQIARFNGLREFRHLEIGSKIQFPPLGRA